MASMRSRFWVIAGNASVRHVIATCVKGRKLRSSVQEQKMANLPPCRMDCSLPPFSYVAVDYFVPFLVKEGRKELKRYGVLFTCMVSRAVHLEVSKTLETSAFINVLRRFVARRGNIVELWSDNGTNFVGTHNELKRCLLEMKQNAVEKWATKHEIRWIFNPPSASHMGGTWERCIRTVRKVLNGLISERMPLLNDDEFHTLLCEVENIINTRPLTTVSTDSSDPEPLTPAHLLMLKPSFTRPFPGVFQESDLYTRRRWRRIQYLSGLFWTRWRREYLAMLQERSKWHAIKRDLHVGDIVLLKEESPRNKWPLGRIEKTEIGRDGHVRVVHVRTATSSVLCRPVSKLVLLVESKD